MGKKLIVAWNVRLKLWAEGDKLRAEGDKLWAEGSKLYAEGSKLYAEGHKLYAESYKLWAEGDKLRAEGDKLWAEAILSIVGNVVTEWDWSGPHCTVEGVTYKHRDVRVTLKQALASAKRVK